MLLLLPTYPHIAKDKALTKIILKIKRRVAREYQHNVPINNFLHGVVYEVFQLSNQYEAVASFDGLAFGTSLETLTNHIATQIDYLQNGSLTTQQQNELLYIIHFTKALSHYPSSKRSGYKHLILKRIELKKYAKLYNQYITKLQSFDSNDTVLIMTKPQDIVLDNNISMEQKITKNNNKPVTSVPKHYPKQPMHNNIALFNATEIISTNIAYNDITMFENKDIQKALKALLPKYNFKYVYKKSNLILNIDRKTNKQLIGDTHYIIITMRIKAYVNNELINSRESNQRIIANKHNIAKTIQQTNNTLLDNLLQFISTAIRE